MSATESSPHDSRDSAENDDRPRRSAPVTRNDSGGGGKRRRSRRRRRGRDDQPTQSTPPAGPAFEGPLKSIVDNFVVCGRCSFFLAGYRAHFGTTSLEAAQASSRHGWLALPWSLTLRDLVEQSYGVRIFEDVVHLDGVCSNCGRSFVFSSDLAGTADDDDAAEAEDGEEEEGEDSAESDAADDDAQTTVGDPIFAIQMPVRGGRRARR